MFGAGMGIRTQQSAPFIAVAGLHPGHGDVHARFDQAVEVKMPECVACDSREKRVFRKAPIFNSEIPPKKDV
jgi:hypothetical protein